MLGATLYSGITTSPTEQDLRDICSILLGLVTRLRAGTNGIRIPVGKRYFYRLQNVHTSSEARLASCSVLTRASFLQVERPAREALHPRSSIAQLSVVTPQIPPECLCGLYWDNFTFTFGVTLTVSLRRRNEEVLVN